MGIQSLCRSAVLEDLPLSLHLGAETMSHMCPSVPLYIMFLKLWESRHWQCEDIKAFKTDSATLGNMEGTSELEQMIYKFKSRQYVGGSAAVLA